MAGDEQPTDATFTRVKVSLVVLLFFTVTKVDGQACTAQNCRPPTCFCKGGDIPGGIPLASTPQMIMLTFDDAVNEGYFPLYESLYVNKVNPGGCPARGTFYVCHDYSNYQMVQTLYNSGHEIASHSISHRLPSNWWSWASTQEWSDEIEGQREILSSWTNIPKSEIRGMRAPYLSIGGDAQFQMISSRLADNFVYDSSVVSTIHQQSAFVSPTWPYTMDFPPTDECLIQPCPTRSFPGVWEIPLVTTQTSTGQWCSMEDECTPGMSEQEVYDFFTSNLDRHYTSNRAPFGIFLHGPFLDDPGNSRALERFMTDVSQRGDVFFVTAWQVIQWMRNPTPLVQIGNFFCPIRQNSVQCATEEANFCQFDGGASLVGRRKRTASQGFQIFNEQTFTNETTGNQNIGNQTTGNQTITNQTVGNLTFEEQTIGSGNDTLGNQTAGNQTVVGQMFDNLFHGDDVFLEEQTVVNGSAGNQSFGNQIGGNQTIGNSSSNILAEEYEFENQLNGNQTVGNQTAGGNQASGNQTIILNAENVGFGASVPEKFSLKYLGSARNSPRRGVSFSSRRSLRHKRQAYNGWHNMYTCKPCPQSYPWLGNSEGV